MAWHQRLDTEPTHGSVRGNSCVRAPGLQGSRAKGCKANRTIDQLSATFAFWTIVTWARNFLGALRVILGAALKHALPASRLTAAMRTSPGDLAIPTSVHFSVRGVLSCALAYSLLISPFAAAAVDSVPP